VLFIIELSLAVDVILHRTLRATELALTMPVAAYRCRSRYRTRLLEHLIQSDLGERLRLRLQSLRQS
jgi:hypothetical protein